MTYDHPVPVWKPGGYWPQVMHAVEHDDVALLGRTLARGADPDSVFAEMTLLTHAIDCEGDTGWQNGKPLTVHLTAVVLAYGADPVLAVAGERTPLQTAVGYHHRYAVALLARHIARRYGSDSPALDRGPYRTQPHEPLGEVSATPFEAVTDHNAVLLAQLLAEGADPDRTADGATLLTHAIRSEAAAEVVHHTAILLAFGADPVLREPSGASPLEVAVARGHRYAVDLLGKHAQGL